MRTLMIPAALFAATNVHAVQYDLFSSDTAQSSQAVFAELQSPDGRRRICASWTDGSVCDVPAGDYRLVLYGATWSGSAVQVYIGEPPVSGGIDLTRVYDACEGESVNGITPMSCTATCPASYSAIAVAACTASVNPASGEWINTRSEVDMDNGAYCEVDPAVHGQAVASGATLSIGVSVSCVR